MVRQTARDIANFAMSEAVSDIANFVTSEAVSGRVVVDNRRAGVEGADAPEVVDEGP